MWTVAKTHQLIYDGNMDKEALAYNLRRYRRARGWSMERLADLAGLSKATISRIESGMVTRKTEEQVERLAPVLDVTVDQLISWHAGEGPHARPHPRGHGAAAIRSGRAAGLAAAQPQVGEPLLDDGPDPSIFWLEVTGDCLEPNICPGDALKMSSARRPYLDDVVAVIIDGTRYIKRVKLRDGQPILVSKYGPALELRGAEVEGVMVAGPFRAALGDA